MKRWIFYLIIGLQALFLIGMSVSYYAMDQFSETILLETEPVDPRDPFYGDYVALHYSIEQVPEEKWKSKKQPERGDIVYLLIEEKKGGLYELVSASDQKLSPNENQEELQAKFDWHLEQEGIYQVNVGLDRYFVEEGTGQAIERQSEQVVKILVAPWGQKKIVSVESK
ncbi:GDYXXLXY domain-containing protein [Halobacillus sp. Marseille-Q1614]|uniref:GDYXXLXY domain-containing protein n=1 Tax=Halobacillus sp. Marseille-Q1614 TaxID=2709134 RepID=UPI00156DFD03|nr:GDYXXLXY domain-containing protein [Halobacillus sp. Marseille-Q1614]